ncbi:unnamed protein product, partial [Meganyctiphanes norvegica]
MANLNNDLWDAVNKDDIVSAKIALEGGANPNYGKHLNRELQRVLLVAVNWCDSEKAEMVNLLLKYGADVGTVDDVGDTALHLAARGYNKASIEVLISHNASLTSKNKYSQTPIDVARSENWNDLADWLDEHVKFQDCQQPPELLEVSSRYNQPQDIASANYSSNELMENQPSACQLIDQVDSSKNQPPLFESQISEISQGDGYNYINNGGRVLLFNYVKFNNRKKNRNGAEEDNDAIRDIFGKYEGKYEVIIYDSYTSQETIREFENLQKDNNLNKLDSLIIFISSHGKSRHVFCTRDGEMDINYLRSFLFETPEGCPFLKGKPKIFLANYCQGRAVEKPMAMAVKESSEGDVGWEISLANYYQER